MRFAERRETSDLDRNDELTITEATYELATPRERSVTGYDGFLTATFNGLLQVRQIPCEIVNDDDGAYLVFAETGPAEFGVSLEDEGCMSCSGRIFEALQELRFGAARGVG